MSEVFISYSRHDLEIAKPLVKELTAHGWNVWWDFQLIAGNNFRKEIDQKVKDAKCVIVIWTANSIICDYVIDEANEAKHKLLPIIINDVTPPYGLRNLHAIKASQGEHLNQDDYREVLKNLTQKIGSPGLYPGEGWRKETTTDTKSAKGARRRKLRIVFWFSISFAAVLSTTVAFHHQIAQLLQSKSTTTAQDTMYARSEDRLDTTKMQAEQRESKKPSNQELRQTSERMPIREGNVTPSYINTSFPHSTIAVMIIESGNLVNSISQKIADIYTQNGTEARIGLFKSGFISQKEFKELKDGNSQVLSVLRLDKYAEKIIIGTVLYTFRKGNLDVRMFVCTASLHIDAISTRGNGVKSFDIPNITGNDASEARAKEKAIAHLVDIFSDEYSTL